MNEEICNSFKAQLIDNIYTIVFENTKKWKNALNFLSYNPQYEIIDVLSILNSRSAPTKVMRMCEWQILYSEALPKRGITGIPLIDNKSKANIAYDGWDIGDIEFNECVTALPTHLKEIMNVNSEKPEYWKKLLTDLMNENPYFSSSEVQDNKKLLKFIENSLLYMIDPILQIHLNTADNLETIMIENNSLSNEMLLSVFNNILLIQHILPGHYKRINDDEKKSEEYAERTAEIWNRMTRTLPVRIQDAKNILLVQKTSAKNTYSSGSETERNVDLNEQLQSKINGTESQEY